MGLFRRKKTPDVIDLSERFRQREGRTQTPSNSQQTSNETPFGFFGAIAQTASSRQNSESEDYVDVSSNVEEKRRKLSKRLMDMTNKIEELSNQIYHLQQRVELLERKMGVQGF